MPTRIRFLIARDRRWTGQPVDLAGLGRSLEQTGTVTMTRPGIARIVVELTGPIPADALIAALPPGVVAEPLQVFDLQSIPIRPEPDAAAAPQGSPP